MTAITKLTDQEFDAFRRFLADSAGITLSSAKKAMVESRLAKRLQSCSIGSYSEYLRRLHAGDAAEIQAALDLLTTNETYFFREHRHFDLLAEIAASTPRTQPFRVWSAACSSGEEVYGIAMVLSETLGEGSAWQVLGSDISSRVLDKARAGHYAMNRIENLPAAYLRKFCLKGTGDQDGTLLIDRSLRARVEFRQVNLNRTLPFLGTFDAIFLRNVMIYFDSATKCEVVGRVLQQLKPGGHLFIGHSESLTDKFDSLRLISPAAYQKVG